MHCQGRELEFLTRYSEALELDAAAFLLASLGPVLETLKLSGGFFDFLYRCYILHMVIVNPSFHGGVLFSFSTKERIPWHKTLAAVRGWWEAHTVLHALTFGVGLVSHFQPGVTIHNSGALGVS